MKAPKIHRIHELFISGDLYTAFQDGTNIGTAGNPTYFFKSIYAPIKVPTAQGLPDEYSWIDIGFTEEEIAEIYDILYSPYFVVADNRQQLTYKIKRVLTLNLYKYKKLIEIQGYTFNPLWNVDADERYASADRHGNESGTNTHTVDITTTHESDTTTDNYSRAFNEEGISDTSKPDTRVNNYTNNGNNTFNNVDSHEEDNQDTTSKDYTAITHKVEGQDVEITIDSSLNPLEFDSQADYTHVERHLRQGNIGVTKSTELLEDARKFVRFNVLEEFFKDLNEVILVPIVK